MKKTKNFFKTTISVILGVSFILSGVACHDESGNVEYYDITIKNGIEGGKITADKTRVSAGEDVVLSLTANEGMLLEYATANGVEISFYDGKYTLFSVSDNYVIDASFLPSAATVSFVTGTDEEIEPICATLYEPVGELPDPIQEGAMSFLGWYDAEEGGNLIKRSSLVKSNDFVLYARWEILSEEYLEGLVPYSVTNSAYASNLSAYGISFHTENAAITPTVWITDDEDIDFSEATAIDCTQEYFFEEYVSQGVIDVEELSLVRGEKYLVRVGDAATKIYSEPFTFTAREVSQTQAEFVYITDTQQDYHDNYYTEVNGVAYAGGIEDNFALTTMKTAIASNPEFDFIAHGGDFTNYGSEISYWAEMIDDLANTMFEYPMVVAAGNHESPNWYGANKFGLMGKMFKVNIPEFGAGNVKNGQSGYAFSLDFGPLHFVVLNSNDVYYTNTSNAQSKETLSNAQLNWLISDLKAHKENSATKFSVVMIHEGPVLPGHSSNSGNDHYKTLRGPLLKALREGEADLLLCGHNHYYFSSYPLTYDENASVVIRGYEEKYSSIITKEYTTETIGETAYNTYTDYNSGVDGTVFMEIGNAGPQATGTAFKSSNLAALIEERVFFRHLQSPGKGSYEGVDCNLMMYSYIKVTEDSLIAETYGVPFNANYQKDFAGGATPEKYLIDALLLKK